jgi:hypothetical protein
MVVVAFLPEEVKRMWCVTIWELNFLATGWLVEYFGLSEVHALPYWIK